MIALAGPASASARQTAALKASLTPLQLGHGTTIGFSFHIASSDKAVPPPLTSLQVRYPENLGIALSGLGLATCSELTLRYLGPSGCPAEAKMGYGSGIGELQVQGEVIREPFTVTLVRAPKPDGALSLTFYAQAATPVVAEIALPGLILPASRPYGGQIAINPPLVEAFPGAADIAITTFHATIGPAGLTYYEYVKGRKVPYKPLGVVLPKRCPAHGFRFAATFAFQDGSAATADAVVRCPRTRHG